MKFTREDIIRMVEEEDVEFIRLQFTDIFGTMKNIAITASQLKDLSEWKNLICTCIRIWILLQFSHGDRSRAKWQD